MKIGSHVGMSGKEMLLGSAKEAVSYGADTFMFYTGAPQNTRRKEIEELNIDPAWEYMKEHGIQEIIVHAPYIINLGNAVKPETFSLAVEFLAKEIDRTVSCRSHTLILHPGAHVGEGVSIGTEQIIKGLNEVLTQDMDCCVALETMAGKGSEIGRTFEELARIYDGVKYFILTTVRMFQALQRTGMRTSDSDISVLKRSIISFIMRTLGMFRKYLRRHIYHLWKIQRNHMLLINMKLRCFGQGNLILI